MVNFKPIKGFSSYEFLVDLESTLAEMSKVSIRRVPWERVDRVTRGGRFRWEQIEVSLKFIFYPLPNLELYVYLLIYFLLNLV